jgi:hypothetical protein
METHYLSFQMMNVWAAEDRAASLRSRAWQILLDRKTNAWTPVAPGIEQRTHRKLRIAGGAELAPFQTVERWLGREEAEAAFVACDDAGGAVMDFDDIGSGHGCSFAGMPALLFDDTARFVTTRSATGSGRRREAASGNTLARMTVHLLVHPHAIDLWQSIQCAEVLIDPVIWSMKCLFKFSRATRISFCTMRPKGNGAAPGSEWIAEARFETSGDALLRVAPWRYSTGTPRTLLSRRCRDLRHCRQASRSPTIEASGWRRRIAGRSGCTGADRRPSTASLR